MLVLCFQNAENPKLVSEKFKKTMLSYYCSVDDFSKRVRKTEHGKPYINGVPFSLSHSGEALCMALCSDRTSLSSGCAQILTYDVCDEKISSLGVDIESIWDKDYSRCKKIADTKFFESERVLLDKSKDENEYVKTFSLMWTKKESYSKFTGNGLKDALEFDTLSTHKEFTIYCDFVVINDKKYALSVCYNSLME